MANFYGFSSIYPTKTHLRCIYLTPIDSLGCNASESVSSFFQGGRLLNKNIGVQRGSRPQKGPIFMVEGVGYVVDL